MSKWNGVKATEIREGRVAKRAMLGFLGVGLACLGCCLVSVLGTVALGGLASTVLALISTHFYVAILIGVITGLGILWVRNGRSKGCCASPDADCDSGSCAVPPASAHKGRAKP